MADSGTDERRHEEILAHGELSPAVKMDISRTIAVRQDRKNFANRRPPVAQSLTHGLTEKPMIIAKHATGQVIRRLADVPIDRCSSPLASRDEHNACVPIACAQAVIF